MDTDRIGSVKLNVISNLGDDIWHDLQDPGTYEWWHFDALSDDGRDAVSITFADNYIYSRRYKSGKGDEGLSLGGRVPAILFSYYSNGRLLYSSVQEYTETQFEAEKGAPGCRIGESSFVFRSADYGTGYFVELYVKLTGGRRVKAQFEWLSIESDLNVAKTDVQHYGYVWNVVSPRSDVSGKIEIEGRRGQRVASHHFRGTGLHDHRIDPRGEIASRSDWHWGMAHFYDSTVVFGRSRSGVEGEGESNLVVVRDGKIRLRPAATIESEFSRDIFGMRYPTRLRIVTDDGLQLKAKKIRTLQSGYHFVRFLNEITLMLRDGIPRKTLGLSEFFAPRSSQSKWVNFIRHLGRRK
jgi:carotenoid 1,2-hydratase